LAERLIIMAVWVLSHCDVDAGFPEGKNIVMAGDRVLDDLAAVC
jgi:hypothetical protein